jgi:hypothetical protein
VIDPRTLMVNHRRVEGRLSQGARAGRDDAAVVPMIGKLMKEAC